MASSLLAHLYSHIKGSQEDVATLSLQYIISQSMVLNREFTRLLGASLHRDITERLNYVCQAVGENQERPDIAGIDLSGKEQILCEAKFYAGLTENQPNGYLNRLQKEDAIGLVFICPAARKVTLWNKLIELCKERSQELIEEFCIQIDSVRMSILTWAEIIDSLRRVATAEAVDILPDIYQLDGFCQQMDSEAFVPYTTDDFGPENAIRESRHYDVVDAVFNRIMSNKSISASAKGLRATPYRQGYVRYLWVMDHALSINYDRLLWKTANTEETPFWVEIMGKEFKQPIEYRQAFNIYPESWKSELNNGIALPLFAPTNASLDEVAEELEKQILQYIAKLEESINK